MRYLRGLEEKYYERQEGESIKMIQMACKKLMKGKTVEIIAEELEEDISEIQKICDVAKNVESHMIIKRFTRC